MDKSIFPEVNDFNSKELSTVEIIVDSTNQDIIPQKLEMVDELITNERAKYCGKCCGSFCTTRGSMFNAPSESCKCNCLTTTEYTGIVSLAGSILSLLLSLLFFCCTGCSPMCRKSSCDWCGLQVSSVIGALFVAASFFSGTLFCILIMIAILLSAKYCISCKICPNFSKGFKENHR